MTGYCPDCGNTLCICALVRHDEMVLRADETYARLRSDETASEYLLRGSQSVPGRMTFTVLETKG